jgi:hypothetical protein
MKRYILNQVNEYLGFLSKDSLNNYGSVAAEIKHFLQIFSEIYFFLKTDL